MVNMSAVLPIPRARTSATASEKTATCATSANKSEDPASASREVSEPDFAHLFFDCSTPTNSTSASRRASGSLRPSFISIGGQLQYEITSSVSSRWTCLYESVAVKAAMAVKRTWLYS